MRSQCGVPPQAQGHTALAVEARPRPNRVEPASPHSPLRRRIVPLIKTAHLTGDERLWVRVRHRVILRLQTRSPSSPQLSRLQQPVSTVKKCASHHPRRSRTCLSRQLCAIVTCATEYAHEARNFASMAGIMPKNHPAELPTHQNEIVG